MIEAFAPNGSDHSLHIGSLPRRARCRQDFADARVSYLFSEVIAKDGITVTQQVARGQVKGRSEDGRVVKECNTVWRSCTVNRRKDKVSSEDESCVMREATHI